MKRGYLKIHIAVDVKRRKILALEVTDEKVGDGRMFQPLVEEASAKVKVAKYSNLLLIADCLGDLMGHMFDLFI